MSDVQRFLHAWGLDDSTKRWDPTGQPVLYSTQDDYPRGTPDQRVARNARVAVDDYHHDVAVVMAEDAGLPPHVWAHVSERSLEPGDVVLGMGHPGRYGWSFARGWLSALRPAEPAWDDMTADTLQVEIPISGGNSGGGAYDAWGDLIGIASYGNRGVNGMGFYIGRSAIRSVMSRAGCGLEM